MIVVTDSWNGVYVAESIVVMVAVAGLFSHRLLVVVVDYVVDVEWVPACVLPANRLERCDPVF